MKTHLSVKGILILLAVCLISLLFTTNAAADVTSAKAGFIAAIEEMQSATSLADKYDYVTEADMHLAEYTAGSGDMEDPEFLAAYTVYTEVGLAVKATVNACNTFMDHVETALANDGVSFAILKENLDAAGALLSQLDHSYPGVSGLVNSYNDLYFVYRDKIEICDGYINFAALAAEADTYAKADEYVRRAKDYFSKITIPDYPGLDEAEANIAKATEFMAQKVAGAQRFVHAVNDLYKTDNIAEAIRNAYAIIEEDGVDVTAEGASVAYETLRSAELSYSSTVRKANKLQDEINKLIFSFIH